MVVLRHPLPAFLLILLVLLLAFAFQGSRGLWSPDEGRYVGVALEMIERGDYLHPHLHFEHPHYTKPPLTYWAIAASLNLFGHSEWAARLPHALAYVFTVLLVWAIGRTLFDESRARLATLFHATALLPVIAAQAVTTDTLLTLWETLALFGFVRAWRSPRQTRWVLLMWLGFGLAFLTKGPPGLLPLLAVAVLLVWQRDWALLRRLFRWPGLLLFLVVGGGWYLWVLADTPGLLDYLLRFEVVERIAGAAHHRHGEWYGGLLVYGPTLLIGTLPWGLLLLARPWRQGKSGGNGDRLRFLWLWFLSPLAVFMLARSRLPFYLLPLFVPLALLLAAAIPDSWLSRQQAWVLSSIVLAAILVGLKGYAGQMRHEQDDRQLAAELQAVAGGHYSEYVFVNTSPRYGLHFYLGGEVEHVCLPAACPRQGLTADEALSEELLADEARRLFLVPAASKQGFLAQVAAVGRMGVQVGELRGLVLMRLQPAE